MVLQRFLPWACSIDTHSVVPAPVDVAASGLLRQRSLAKVSWRSLAWVCSCRYPWLGPVPNEVHGSGLLFGLLLPHTWSSCWGDLPRACSGGGHWFMVVYPCYSIGPWIGWFPQISLVSAWSCRGPRVEIDLTEVSDSKLIPWQSLPCTCSCIGCLYGPSPVEVAGLHLLPQRSFIRPRLAEVSRLVLLHHWFFHCTTFCECFCLGHSLADVPVLGQRSLA